VSRLIPLRPGPAPAEPADAAHPAPAGSGRARRGRARVKRELLRAKRACRLCDVSEATWWRWDAAGKVPAGLKIGGGKFWRQRELLAWIEGGCPDRQTWNALREKTR
jgi:predicted DNA-binding transcriptional regulator AlpA